MSFSSQLILVSILKELTKEKLQISYLIENVFLITVDFGKHSEGIDIGETTDQLTSLRMSFSSELILVSKALKSLSLYWSHIPHCWKSHVTAHLIN